MLHWYAQSIGLWMALIYFTSWLLAARIEKNGWLDDVFLGTDNGIDAILGVLLISMVPCVRLGVWGAIIYMAIDTKEHYEEMVNQWKDDK